MHFETHLTIGWKVEVFLVTTKLILNYNSYLLTKTNYIYFDMFNILTCWWT